MGNSVLQLRSYIPFAAVILTAAFSVPALAEAKFSCAATKPDAECAFTVFDDKGATNFVLQSGQTHGLNDNTIGMKYCVAVGPKGTPRNDYPKCWNESPAAPQGHKTVKANVVND
jgi:hypothetical protein